MKLTSFLILPALLATALRAELPKESDYYTITSIPAPAGEVIEGGGIELIPDGRVAVCTRRGQIWMIENAFEHPAKPAKWTLFA